MRKLASFLILTAWVGGCGHCGHCAAAPVPEAKPKLVCPAGVKDCPCPCSTGGACTCDKAAVLSQDGKYRLAGWYSSAGVWQYDFWVPVAEYRAGGPTNYASPFGGCAGGSCSGGSCRGR